MPVIIEGVEAPPKRHRCVHCGHVVECPDEALGFVCQRPIALPCGYWALEAGHEHECIDLAHHPERGA